MNISYHPKYQNSLLLFFTYPTRENNECRRSPVANIEHACVETRGVRRLYETSIFVVIISVKDEWKEEKAPHCQRRSFRR